MTRAFTPQTQAVFEVLQRTAQRGEACPSDEALTGLIGAKSKSSASGGIRALDAANVIRVDRSGRSRRVAIVATGRTTAWSIPLHEERRRFDPPGQSDMPRIIIDRDPCGRCGVRGEIGCVHRPLAAFA